MLFKGKLLQNDFDIGKELKLEHASIDSLVEKISKQTESILDYIQDGQSIECYHQDQNDNTIYINKNDIDEATWYRSKDDIKQILIRNDKTRFSISNRLEDFGVHNSQDMYEYKRYLQVLYFFYMMNYFIFPKSNIFKKLSYKNIDYKKSYETGAVEGEYLFFIISNLLDDSDAFYHFTSCNKEVMDTTYNIVRVIEDIAVKRFDLVVNNDLEEVIKGIITGTSLDTSKYESDPIIQLVEYCNQYNQLAFVKDLYQNIDNVDLFDLEDLEVLPPDSWKNNVIVVDYLDGFLKEDELYYFCKQTRQEIKSNQRIIIPLKYTLNKKSQNMVKFI